MQVRSINFLFWKLCNHGFFSYLLWKKSYIFFANILWIVTKLFCHLQSIIKKIIYHGYINYCLYISFWVIRVFKFWKKGQKPFINYLRNVFKFIYKLSHQIFMYIFCSVFLKKKFQSICSRILYNTILLYYSFTCASKFYDNLNVIDFTFEFCSYNPKKFKKFKLKLFSIFFQIFMKFYFIIQQKCK